MQHIDTDNEQFWRQLFTFAAMIDEWQSQMNVDFIRAGHEGLLLQEIVHGGLSFGYFRAASTTIHWIPSRPAS